MKPQEKNEGEEGKERKGKPNVLGGGESEAVSGMTIIRSSKKEIKEEGEGARGRPAFKAEGARDWRRQLLPLPPRRRPRPPPHLQQRCLAPRP